MKWLAFAALGAVAVGAFYWLRGSGARASADSAAKAEGTERETQVPRRNVGEGASYLIERPIYQDKDTGFIVGDIVPSGLGSVPRRDTGQRRPLYTDSAGYTYYEGDL